MNRNRSWLGSFFRLRRFLLERNRLMTLSNGKMGSLFFFKSRGLEFLLQHGYLIHVDFGIGIVLHLIALFSQGLHDGCRSHVELSGYLA
jgi:hypothetical protein